MASSNLGIQVGMEQLRTLAFGSISGTYAGIGTSFAHPARMIYIVNETNGSLTFSIDGVNDYFVLAASSQLVFDFMSNNALPSGSWTLAQGTRIYVKGSPSSGSVYLSVFYGSGVLA